MRADVGPVSRKPVKLATRSYVVDPRKQILRAVPLMQVIRLPKSGPTSSGSCNDSYPLGTNPGTGTAYHPTTLPTVRPYALPGSGALPGLTRPLGSGADLFCSDLVLGDHFKSFRTSQLPHKFVNLSFTITNMKNTLTDLCGN